MGAEGAGVYNRIMIVQPLMFKYPGKPVAGQIVAPGRHLAYGASRSGYCFCFAGSVASPKRFG